MLDHATECDRRLAGRLLLESKALAGTHARLTLIAISYRDDTDAALARADALEHELELARAERDRLKSELERANRPEVEPQTVVEPPPVLMKLDSKRALSRAEVGELLKDVEFGLQRARRDAGYSVAFASIFAIASVPIAIVWNPAVLMFLGLALLVLFVGAARFTDNPQQVLAALGSQPKEVLDLQLAKNGVIVKTRTHSAYCWSGSATELLVRLTRRCPDAQVSRVGES